MGKSAAGKKLEGQMGIALNGVIYGLEAPVPASGLTLTYTEGLIRVIDPDLGQGYQEYRIASSTKVLTTAKEAWIYVDKDGAVQAYEQTEGDPKPKLDADGIGERSEFLYLVRNDATDIDQVFDLRRFAGIDLVVETFLIEFNTAIHGTHHFVPGFRGRIVALDAVVGVAIGATAAATVTPSIVTADAVATAVTNGALSLAGGSAVGVRDLEIPSGANHFKPLDRIQLVTAKGTTEGGAAIVNVVMERF